MFQCQRKESIQTS